MKRNKVDCNCGMFIQDDQSDHHRDCPNNPCNQPEWLSEYAIQTLKDRAQELAVIWIKESPPCDYSGGLDLLWIEEDNRYAAVVDTLNQAGYLAFRALLYEACRAQLEAKR